MKKWFLVGALLAGLSAGATTLLAMDVPGLARGADAVVHGSVTRLDSHWTGDHLRIVTDIELEVTEALKGSVPKRLTVVQPGGVVGDIGQTVSGLASFKLGEEVVVFLERRAGDSFLVSGMAQGKFRVERSSDGKAAFAVPDSVGDALLLDPQTHQPVSSPKLAPRPPTLEELKVQIKAAIKAPAGAFVEPAGRTPTLKQGP
jgi:hypothetical protein